MNIVRASLILTTMLETTKEFEESLQSDIQKTLLIQGYEAENGWIRASDISNEGKRKLHKLSRIEKMQQHVGFIKSFRPTASEYIRNSDEIDVAKIKPTLREIKSGTKDGNIFLWWNLVWWSLPYSKSYGRQMRFLVWDEYHDCPIGLFGLQSPILSWSARDKHLNIEYEQRDYWVNQSLSAQRLGALPPYNKFLGGKLVASLMASDDVRKAFLKKYENVETILKARKLPAHLLFITTTGAYGKSSVYNRLKFNNENICKFIGYTRGNGSFHIPDNIYEKLIDYLRDNGYEGARSFGSGPSIKMRNIDRAMKMLGFNNGNEHGMKRAVYLFPFVENLNKVIQDGEKPIWHNRTIDELTDFWKARWASKRIDDIEKTFFNKNDFDKNLDSDLEECSSWLRENY